MTGGERIPEVFGRYFFWRMRNMGWVQTNGLRATWRSLRPCLFAWPTVFSDVPGGTAMLG